MSDSNDDELNSSRRSGVITKNKKTNVRYNVTSFFDKYLMHTYQASVRAKVNGSSQVIKTEIRALNAQDARWLLWAQYGFHSIQFGPSLVNTR
jgi:hypothetical protein